MSSVDEPWACSHLTQMLLPHTPSLSARIFSDGLFQSSTWMCAAHWAWVPSAASPRAGTWATRTIQHGPPLFLKWANTESDK